MRLFVAVVASAVAVAVAVASAASAVIDMIIVGSGVAHCLITYVFVCKPQLHSKCRVTTRHRQTNNKPTNK
jgi:hypothetical protein